MAASFLSSRVKNLNIGVSGYTNNTNVLDVIGNITSSGTFTSTILDGTAPLQVSSTTLVENLNVELLNGRNGDFYLNLDNSTGTFSPGDIIYAPSENTIAKLNIGNDGNLLTVVNGLPSWEQITAEDLGGISGIDVYDDDKDPTFIGKVNKFNFEFGLFAELDSVDQDLAIVSLDLSSITPESIGAVTGIGILEESIYIGEVENIDFIGENITAAIDVEGTATVTLTDDPTFNTVRVTVAPGTAPFIVNSNTVVSKLNADLLDGQHGSYYTNASNLSTGTVPVARLTGEYDIDISGNALSSTNSSYINVTKRNDDTSYKVTFTDSIGGNQGIYIDEDLNQFTYTPISGKLSSSILASSVAVGTAPLEITSTTLVSNLNVDLLDNQHGSYYLDLDNATNILDETKGGTGLNSYAAGDILYASGVDTLAKLPIGTDNNVLYIEGNQIVWKALTPENVGSIDGVILQDDGAALGKVSTLSFNTNLVASIRVSNTDAGDISLADDITLNSVTTISDSTINGQKIGRGGGNVETNTVLGFEGLLSNTGGSNNVSIGYQSSYLNENGNYNVSVGVQSLFNNEGNNNTAFGHNSLFGNQTGNYNTSIGSFTGSSVVASRNIIIGSGTDENNLFDVPNLNQNFQLAIGHNVSGTSNYWIVGDENYNIGIGTSFPEEKLDIEGNVIVRGDLKVGTNLVQSTLDLQGSAFVSEKISINTTSQTAQVNVDGDVLITANGSTDLLRLTQTGTGNVLVVEDSTNPDLTSFAIDSDGNVGIKISNPQHSLDVGGDAKLHNKLYDYTDSSGSNGDILISTGNNIEWTSTTSVTVGNSTNAANINISEKNDNVSYSVVFTSTSTGNQEVYIDTDVSDLVYNPSTGKLSSQIFVSTIADGTAPLEVTSTTLVTNLNADLLDGEEGSYYLDLDNATGTLAATKGGTGISTYTTGDIIYSSASDTLSSLAIGNSGNVLTVESGVPVWKTITAGDIGAIAGINVQEDDTLLGSVTSINFGTGILAEIDPVDSNIANITVDTSGLLSGIDIQEDDTLLGSVTSINFGTGILAEIDPVDSNIANITFTDDPSFNTIELTVADGTAPLTITSTTLVSNLNADLLDGEQGTYYLDLDNSTGTLAATKGGTGISTYTKGDIIYSSAVDTLEALALGTENQLLTVDATGVPVWKTVTASDLGAIAGVNVQENDTPLGLVETINFGTGIVAEIDSVDSTIANITIDASALASNTVNILEDGTSLGAFENINFISSNLTAADAGSSNATITLTDDPSFNTVELTVADGTAPLTITSTTLVSNLNADLLDGEQGTYYLDLDNATNILDETKGGTGLSTYTTGDILYSSASDTLSTLPIGASSTVLTVESGVPVWKSLDAGDVGAIAGVDVQENGVSIGVLPSINFGDRLIATLDPINSSLANITFTDDPSFNTVTTTNDSIINELTVGKGGGDVSTNTAVGYQALESNTTGSNNTANGYLALYYNTTGSNNVATGYQPLYSNTYGSNNTANGYLALRYNTTGSNNVATGYQALYYSTYGSNNTANGYQALYFNSTGTSNVANGWRALYSNTTGNYNVATGRDALFSNTIGTSNVATGMYALLSNTTGINNTATGYQALYSNTTGAYNIATGTLSLNSNTTGQYNVANGYAALSSNTTGTSNVATGYQALYSNTTGNQNVANGYQALYLNTTGINNVANGYQALYSNTIGVQNVATGLQALRNNTTGTNNTATGHAALRSNTTGTSNVATGYAALYSNTTGINNVANGPEALYLNTTGTNNVANGYTALYSNTTGTNNVANGSEALYSNTTGAGNVANGYQALRSNTTGIFNVANGYAALSSNTTGTSNVATGVLALYSNTTGTTNVATGLQALYSNTTGNSNVANGYQALRSNTTGIFNVATGMYALYSNTTGTSNVANGYQALFSNTTGTTNVANGYQALYFNTTGNQNIATGYQVLYSNTTGTNNVATGYQALYSNTTGNFNSHYGSYTGISTTTSRRIVIGSGTDNSNLFDTPDTTKDTQLAIGHNVSGTSSYWIVGDENYNIGIGVTEPQYKLHVGGDFAATTKSFVITHPSDPEKKLRHACIESPYNGVRYTGRDCIPAGTTITNVSIPEYVKDLIHKEGITIQLTNIKHGKVLWVGDIYLNQDNFEVGVEDTVDKDLEFFWELTGIRKDIEQFEVEY